MAHEFGHALQGRTGILISSHALGQEAGDKGTELQFSRRLETQADCFSGMFIRAVSQSIGVQPQDEDGILNIYVAIGDDKLQKQSQGYVVPDAFTHGSAEQRARWFKTGLQSGDIRSCDTFSQ